MMQSHRRVSEQLLRSSGQFARYLSTTAPPAGAAAGAGAAKPAEPAFTKVTNFRENYSVVIISSLNRFMVD